MVLSDQDLLLGGGFVVLGGMVIYSLPKIISSVVRLPIEITKEVGKELGQQLFGTTTYESPILEEINIFGTTQNIAFQLKELMDDDIKCYYSKWSGMKEYCGWFNMIQIDNLYHAYCSPMVDPITSTEVHKNYWLLTNRKLLEDMRIYRINAPIPARG
jgi:hypothetical protein